MKTIISLVGARPQFVKEAVVGAEARRRGAWRHVLVHSGQHYDANMSDIFFAELEMKQPDHFLGVGSGTHGVQTADVLAKFEALLMRAKPDTVLVYGDTNTTLAGALAAVKLKIPVAHVEAGIRQHPKDMPEEINRVLTDRISARLFCCSELAARNLADEGMTTGVTVPGDVMYDLYLKMAPRLDPDEARTRLGLDEGGYIVATIHRDFNTDDPKTLAGILDGLNRAHRESGLEVLLPLHPRTSKRVAEFGLEEGLTNLRVVEPIGYLDLMSLTQHCAAVVTDSGGYQKEAYYAGKRAVVLMPDTGWRELTDAGWNLLCPPDAERIARAVAEALAPAPRPENIYGAGDAGERIVESLAE
ncbi:MAG: UDP-N-acetylglucosamine 2-epimerase (non-hydrolyzing) [Synergistaceae bacterium]|nr:UDP-N-acetylglucosamine 2-epimerase (non-hydrolyzing) [Synergistaceae bacterium]